MEWQLFMSEGIGSAIQLIGMTEGNEHLLEGRTLILFSGCSCNEQTSAEMKDSLMTVLKELIRER